MRALATLTLPSLEGVVLLDCPSVTDEGIAERVKFRSLRWLQLEGTSVTDRSLRTLSTAPQLNGLNVARTQVTLDGLTNLVRATSLRELAFSSHGEASLKVCEVLRKCTQIERFDIVDRSNQ